MIQDFDNIALQYDQTFTHTNIGKYQRDLVYGFLEGEIIDFTDKKILEINAGTGEDAIWMAQKGAEITCTDISIEMVEVAKVKAKSLKDLNLSHQVVDVTKLAEELPNQKYDVIFSNFGGLNCLSEKELKQFFKAAKRLLTPNGKLILVIMPSFCLWETNYFLAKFNFKQAFRRLNKKGVDAKVGDLLVKTYYHSPITVKKMTNNFAHSITRPVGFFIPPSYLEPFFKKRVKFLNWLWRREQSIKNKSFLASLSDHYFISFKNKS